MEQTNQALNIDKRTHITQTLDI